MSTGFNNIAITNDPNRLKPATETVLTPHKLPPASFQKTGFGIKPNKVFQANEFNRFKESNKDLLYVISKSDKAKDIYSKKEIQTRDDLVDVIAEAANESLTGKSKDILTKEKLKKDPLAASLITLNTGGIRDILNKDEDKATIIADAAESASQDAKKFHQDVIERLAEKAANSFEKDHVLNDKEFFVANPKAAIHVIKNSEVVQDFTESDAGKDRAKVFKEEVKREGNQALILNDTNKFIQDTLQSSTYTNDFLNSNSDFTDYLAASIAVEDQPTVARILKENPQHNLQNPAAGDRFNYDEVTHDIVSRQAFQKLEPDSRLTREDLKSHLGLARLLLKDTSLQTEFNKEEAQYDFGVLLNNERPKIETPTEKFQTQFRTALKERTLVSIIA